MCILCPAHIVVTHNTSTVLHFKIPFVITNKQTHGLPIFVIVIIKHMGTQWSVPVLKATDTPRTNNYYVL